MDEKASRSCCPISLALDILGDKWTLLVIRDLVFLRKRHFKDFQSSPEKIATNILSNRLKMLECAGIISRKTDPENARQVVYDLTDKGIDLIPMLVEMILWGTKYDQRSAAPPAVIKRIKKDRKGYLAELQKKLKSDRD